MATNTSANTPEIQSCAKQTAVALGDFEGHLQILAGSQHDLQTAVRGAAGNALYTCLGNAHTTGKALARALEGVIDALRAAGVKFDSSDLDARDRLLYSAGMNNSDDTGSTYGNWNDNVLEKVNTDALPKPRVDVGAI